MKMRFAWYAGVSAALAGGVVMSAFHQRANFYSAMVHLSQSSLSLMVLVNLVFVVYGSVIYGLQRLCFGPLRPVEIEQLYEKAWFAVTETCLAMTIFREEVGAFFLVMFTALVTGKVWGWIGEGRVEVLEQQPPANPRLFHARLTVSLLLSIAYDVWLLNYAINTVVQQARPTMMVMFLFEFAVLTVCSFHTGSKYLISLMEQRVVKLQTQQRLEERRRQVREERAAILRRREAEGVDGEPDEELPDENDVDEMDIEVPGWESKGQWVLTLDLIADFVKLAIYTAFFCVLFTFYGLPIHIIRDWFMTTRSFLKRLSALIRYRQALKDMNQYADATAEDLERENTCIICREEMRPWDANDPTQVERTRAKKLPCGHILHFGCLKSWLERQQVCPTCRRPVAREGEQPARNGGEAMVFRFGLNLPGGQNRPPPVPANGQAPAGQAAPAAANNQENNQNQNGAVRMFNLGPLRLGIAQGGVNDIQEMAQRLGMPVDAGNQPAAAPPTTPQPHNADAVLSLDQVRAQLHDLSQRVQQELQILHAAAQDIQSLNFVAAEVARLRQLQQQHRAAQQGAGPAAPAVPATYAAPVIPIGQPPQFPTFPQWVHYPATAHHAGQTGQTASNTVRYSNAPRFPAAFTAQSGAGYGTAIPAGSPDLPEGVVIPPGWSLLPLQRLEGWTSPMDATAPQALPAEGVPRLSRDGNSPAVVVETAFPISTVALDPNPIGAEGSAENGPTATSAIRDPSPVAPNWGGSAQFFGSGHRNENSTVAQDEPGEGSTQAANRESSAPESGERGTGVDNKGKGRTATVEEAEDEEDRV